MTEPTTEAGKRLLNDRSDAVVAAYREGLAHDILAIEAEARADVLREIERLLPIIRELALPSSMASGDDGECFFCGGDANEPEDHAEDCLVTLARAALKPTDSSPDWWKQAMAHQSKSGTEEPTDGR
jgi:hypothetical protein